MTRPAEWRRLARRHWPILALVMAIPAFLSAQTWWLGPLLLGVYALVGLLASGVWRRWGYRAGHRFVRRRRREHVLLARLRARPGARELPWWRVLLMFLAPAAFGFFLANGLAGLVSARLGVQLSFDDLGIFVLAAMWATCFLSVFIVPIAWIVRASGIRKVDTRTGRNDPLKPLFLVDHLTAATGITALLVLASSVKPDETIAPLLDMALNTLTVASLTLPGTLLATLLYVWFGLDAHVEALERDLGALPVDSYFDTHALRRPAPDPEGTDADAAPAPPPPSGPPGEGSADSGAGGG